MHKRLTCSKFCGAHVLSGSVMMPNQRGGWQKYTESLVCVEWETGVCRKCGTPKPRESQGLKEAAGVNQK